MRMVALVARYKAQYKNVLKLSTEVALLIAFLTIAVLRDVSTRRATVSEGLQWGGVPGAAP